MNSVYEYIIYQIKFLNNRILLKSGMFYIGRRDFYYIGATYYSYPAFTFL
jgi:hypothetical protein